MSDLQGQSIQASPCSPTFRSGCVVQLVFVLFSKRYTRLSARSDSILELRSCVLGCSPSRNKHISQRHSVGPSGRASHTPTPTNQPHDEPESWRHPLPAKAKVLAGLGGSRPGGLPRDVARRLILIGSAPESGCGDAEPGIYGGFFGEKDLEGVGGTKSSL